MDNNFERLEKVEWAAEYLGVSKNRIWYLVRNGLIPHIVIGKRSYRFLPSRVIEWAEAGGMKQTKGEDK